MLEKKTKYDTDPLDPEYVRRTDEIMGATREVASSEPTSEQNRWGDTNDAPTRRYYEPPPEFYPSAFVSQTQQPTTTNGGGRAQRSMPNTASQPPSSRPVPKLGVPENIAQVIPYIPFYIGLIASVIELIVVPRSEVRTRFHAAQGLAAQLVIFAINFLLGIPGDNSFGKLLFLVSTVVFVVISVTRVWKGKEHRIAPLAGATKWLNERIEPRT